MSRLVRRVKGGRPAGTSFIGGRENGDGQPVGILLGDGTFHSLEGQPPVATSRGWGNLGFLYSQRRGN